MNGKINDNDNDDDNNGDDENDDSTFLLVQTEHSRSKLMLLGGGI